MVAEVRVAIPEPLAAEVEGKTRELTDLARICVTQVDAGAKDHDILTWIQSEGWSLELSRWMLSQVKHHGEAIVIVMPDFWVSDSGEYVHSGGLRVSLQSFKQMRRSAGIKIGVIALCMFAAGCFLASFVLRTWPEIVIAGLLLTIGSMRLWHWFKRR